MEQDMKYLGIAVAVVVIVIALATFIESATASGPNCPGKDPAWLGFCGAAPEGV